MLRAAGHGSLLNRQFHLPRFASVYSAANEYQHCWEGTCDGLASCPGESCQGESVQIHSLLSIRKPSLNTGHH